MTVFTPVRTPSLLTRAFPGLIWQFPTKEKTIFLTFDDGPTPGVTDWTLDVLKDYNAEATFFCVGSNVKDHLGLYERIIEEGHGIGNHSFTHLKGWSSTTDDYINDINSASRHITSKLFRPPYGQITPAQIKALKRSGFKVVMWTILSMDWEKKVTKEACARNVWNHADKGDIIVFHDSKKAWPNLKFALPVILDYFSERGFEFKRIPE